jgi:hypothetical protein
MNPSNSNNHLIQLDFDRKVAAATRKFLGGITSLPVGSQVLTPEQIAQVFDARVTSGEAVQTAAAARTAAVKANRDKRSQTAPFVAAFRRVVQGMFSESPDTLAQFGLAPPKTAEKSVAVKADAIAKNKATRAARHTMGSKQKAKVKGDVPPTTSEPEPEPAPAPVPTPAASSVSTPAPAKPAS